MSASYVEIIFDSQTIRTKLSGTGMSVKLSDLKWADIETGVKSIHALTFKVTGALDESS